VLPPAGYRRPCRRASLAPFHISRPPLRPVRCGSLTRVASSSAAPAPSIEIREVARRPETARVRATCISLRRRPHVQLPFLFFSSCPACWVPLQRPMHFPPNPTKKQRSGLFSSSSSPPARRVITDYASSGEKAGRAVRHSGYKAEASQAPLSPPETDPAGGASHSAERRERRDGVRRNAAPESAADRRVDWLVPSVISRHAVLCRIYTGLRANGVSPSWNIGQVQVQRTRFPWKSTLLRPLSWTSALQHDFLEVSLSAAFQEPSFHAAVLASNKVLGT